MAAISPARLRERRQALGLSMNGLASALGVEKSTVANWEYGKYPCSPLLGLALEALEKRKRRADFMRERAAARLQFDESDTPTDDIE